MSEHRPVRALSLAGVSPSIDLGSEPECVWVRPDQLRVDELYQRNLSERSIKLIRKIIANFDWSKLKPPIVVAVGDDLYDVIDGQHTAIAAASHPGVEKIPVMVNRVEDKARRAASFLGHNRDRLGVTPSQLHHAAVVAGDEDALTVEQVCARAGIKILRSQPGAGYWKPRTTMAVNAINSACQRRGAMGARRILQVLGDANYAPILASHVRAVELLLFEEPYRGTIAEDDLVSVIMNIGPVAEQDVKTYAASNGLKVHEAFAAYWARRAPLRRIQSDETLVQVRRM